MVEGRVGGAPYCQVLLGERAAEPFAEAGTVRGMAHLPKRAFLQTWEFSTAGECERVGVPGDWACWCWDGFHSLPEVED